MADIKPRGRHELTPDQKARYYIGRYFRQTLEVAIDSHFVLDAAPSVTPGIADSGRKYRATQAPQQSPGGVMDELYAIANGIYATTSRN